MKSLKKISGLLLLALLAHSAVLTAQDDELLPPEEAFALTARVEGDALVAEYRIAPGYYMYRERFEFRIESSDAPARFGVAVIPDGEIKIDEFFGKMETYRDKVTIKLPIIYENAAASRLEVKAVSQGCADIGVCYPPLKQSLAVDIASSATILPSAWIARDIPLENMDQDVAALQALLSQVTENFENNRQSASASGESLQDADPLAALQALGADIGLDADDEILHPDEAFILSARLDANNIIQTNILMARNIYLYREKIKIAMAQGTGHELGAISVPRGKKKVDEFLGPTEVIYDQVNVSIPIISAADASGQFALSYQYQGCVEDRICYPPITKYLVVNATDGLVQVVDDLNNAGNLSTAAASNEQQAAPPVSEQQQFTQLLADESLLIVIGLFFLAGIGLTFTPCVFPMIPILSSIIAGQGATITTRKAFSLSLIYVLAMAVTYATAGAIVGYYGAEFNIQIWFQDPIILSVFATIFVLLALSMFGFYELQMPSAIQSRLTAISNSQQGGTLIGVGLMGFFSAIIVGPCITAPLVGALLFISQTQDWLLGGLALFALGLGMGVPLLLIGTSAGKLLPRAGGWMDTVKAIFGVVLLGVAIWLLERILPVGITMALIAALLIASAIYMGALDSLGEAASGWRRLSKSLGLLILVYGITYLIGAAAGSNDLIQPLRGVTAASSAQSGQHLSFRPIKGSDGLQLALNDSVQQGRKTMLDFYADWCISCKEMEKYAFTHPDVLAALADVTTLQADVTDNDSVDSALMSSLGIYGPPAILFFDSNGREIRNRRVVGEMSGERFAAHVNATFQ
ncbi:MAG: protein-disulfide reductase DsbD [Gammaproteobacteria bacterium]|nr:protein-disulfide reductase DsbD [Gammaproteobacteria bacterium]MDH3449522.1 protein-disulfide reductase DsbD [Gammaproteobacteria bacterium]